MAEFDANRCRGWIRPWQAETVPDVPLSPPRGSAPRAMTADVVHVVGAIALSCSSGD